MTILYIVLALNCWYLNFVVLGGWEIADLVKKQKGLWVVAIAIASIIAIPLSPAFFLARMIQRLSSH